MAELRVFLDANVLFTAAYNPDGLSALLIEVGLAGRATHFVTGDRKDFGRWMIRRASLPLRVMTPRQFFTEAMPLPPVHSRAIVRPSAENLGDR